jgi:low temperature requirement protein LtrA
MMDGLSTPRSVVRSLLRDRQGADNGRVTMVELFFDLVFVFAVTQLSHTLLAAHDVREAVEVALLIAAVWWAWVFTSWVTNWLNPERTPVRIALFGWMLAGLVMSAAIPEAFGERGPWFAAAYVSIQVGRTLFFLWAVRHERQALRRNFQRVLVWLGSAGVIWIGGALAAPQQRLAWWCVALLIEVLSPTARFWVPGLGRSSISDWDIDGSHMSERCALFVIIALGESLLATGATFSQGPLTLTTAAGFSSAFLGAVAMWWLYFHRSAEYGHRRIAHSSLPGKHATVAYTYLHLPIVSGIIVGAVADDLVLADSQHGGGATPAIVIGGPALYLLGVAAFIRASHRSSRVPHSHIAGLVALVGVAGLAFAGDIPLLALHMATTAVLVGVILWEEVAKPSSSQDLLSSNQEGASS